MVKTAVNTFVILGLAFSSLAYSADDMYGFAAGGYSKTDFDGGSGDSGAFKLGLGYQFHPQWYAEFGYQQMTNQDMLSTLPTTTQELNDAELGIQSDALVASVLGKASGSMGELFYRLGIMKVDIKGQQFSDTASCQFGDGSTFSLANDQQVTLCEYDEGVAAGVFGIGFDFYLGVNLMLRSEIEHVRGEDGFETNSGYIGLRYNF